MTVSRFERSPTVVTDEIFHQTNGVTLQKMREISTRIKNAVEDYIQRAPLWRQESMMSDWMANKVNASFPRSRILIPREEEIAIQTAFVLKNKNMEELLQNLQRQEELTDPFSGESMIVARRLFP